MATETAVDDVEDVEGGFPLPKRALLPDAIADAIAEAIATRHLRPGERIVETGLTKRFQVSRVPVREALKILATQGILVGGGHRGYRVADYGQKKVEQVFEIRLMLELVLLRDAIRNWQKDSGSLSDLRAVIDRMRRAADADDFGEMLRADLDFHLAIANASGNEVAISMWKTIARHVLIIFNLARYRDIKLSTVVDRHIALLKFIEKQVRSPDSGDELKVALDKHFLARRRQSEEVARMSGLS
ncbi:MAG: GntR family transcriptional regulator [Rhizobiaceae bacterium]|nr:GntR family transcriptional regulator [Rhizobiaceae bacterium]